MCAHVAPVCGDAHVCVCKEKRYEVGQREGVLAASKRPVVCGYCIERETEGRMGEQMDGGLD